MSKTRKFLATLTMVAVTTTASLTAISSAQAFTPIGPGGLIGPGPIIDPPIFIPPGGLAPPPPPPPGPPAPPAADPHHHGMKPGLVGLIGVGAGLLIGSTLANKNQAQPAPAAGLPVEHYLFCDKKYLTYDVGTDSFMGNDGFRHRCNSPWSY
jgi:hypothetical protein